MKNILLLLVFVLFSSCALRPAPSSSLIDSVPVVNIGDSKDIPAEHIVYIPANTEFPIQFSVKGTIFNEDVISTAMASFKQDMYLYKYWASLDGKKWVHSHKLMSVQPSGGFDSKGGKVEVKLDLAE